MDGDTTKMLAWGLGRRKLRSKGRTSVRQPVSFREDIQNQKGTELCNLVAQCSGVKHCAASRNPIEAPQLTRLAPRQKVPIYWACLHPRPHLNRNCRLYQNAPNPSYPPRIPSLCPKVRSVREAPQEPCCARVASVSG